MEEMNKLISKKESVMCINVLLDKLSQPLSPKCRKWYLLVYDSLTLIQHCTLQHL